MKKNLSHHEDSHFIPKKYFIKPLNSNYKPKNLSEMKSLNKITDLSKNSFNHTIYDEFKNYMKDKLNARNSPKINNSTVDEFARLSLQSQITSVASNQVEKILYNKYKLKRTQNNFEKRMKVFQLLDSFVDVKDYLKKMNLMYNPQMKNILKEGKKKVLRKEFNNSFGIDINDLESPRLKVDYVDYDDDSLKEDNHLLISKAKETIKMQREQIYYDDFMKEPEEKNFLGDQLKRYLIDNLKTNDTKINPEQEIDGENKIFDKIDEIYQEKKPENTLKKLATLKLFRKNSPDPTKRTRYAQEMNKFQTLVENSIDFNLIKNCKNDEDDIPSHFYYNAYKQHAKKVQQILKKTCLKLYSNKLNLISSNKEKLSIRVKNEAEKIQKFLDFKVKKNSSENHKNEKISKNNTITRIPTLNKFFLTENNSLSIKTHSCFPETLNSLPLNINFEDFNIDSERKPRKKREFDENFPKIPGHNSLIKTKFSNLMKKIHTSQEENQDKKILIMKEIDDIENIFEKDLEQIKNRQFKRVESIRDFTVDQQVDKKVKMLKSYFSNKKKGKFIIKL